jgi:hypothetical protein
MATKPTTFITKTVRGSRREILSYDADVFHENIILSASLIIKDIKEEGLYDVPFDSPDAIPKYGITHYNTVHEAEPLSMSSEILPDGWSFYQTWHTQDLYDLLPIKIYPKPKSTNILGHKQVDKNSQHSYSINKYYGEEGFTYQWSIEGLASFDGSNLEKEVVLNFGSEDSKIILTCKITNPSGCYRYIIKNIYIGLIHRDLLVIRNTYF